MSQCARPGRCVSRSSRAVDRPPDRRGREPAGGRGRLRCQPRDRLSAVVSLSRGRLGGARRSPLDSQAPAASALGRGRAEDPGRARPPQGGAARRLRGRRAPSLLEIARRYTRPYSPWTNGKAEALIKTLLREWAYRFAYPTSVHRARALPGFIRWYHRRRPHSSLGGRPPINRVSQVCGYYPMRAHRAA